MANQNVLQSRCSQPLRPDSKQQPDLAIPAYGFCPLAMILEISNLVPMLATGFALSMQKLVLGIPVVGNNCFAISVVRYDDGWGRTQLRSRLVGAFHVKAQVMMSWDTLRSRVEEHRRS